MVSMAAWPQSGQWMVDCRIMCVNSFSIDLAALMAAAVALLLVRRALKWRYPFWHAPAQSAAAAPDAQRQGLKQGLA
jgi:hypothetical protein